MSVKQHNVTVIETTTANGGSEWRLAVGGVPIKLNESGVGIFTEPGKSAAEMLLPLLRRASGLAA